MGDKIERREDVDLRTGENQYGAVEFADPTNKYPDQQQVPD